MPEILIYILMGLFFYGCLMALIAGIYAVWSDDDI